ncbi:hypothetical protein SAMN02745150_00343 [Brevinema andersonii]|uniref:Tetratricopeptide repeat-containing protein n=1 Tax=Brevinema andersonii TaxID=34097 RepID=A0A1I1D5U5_BREAD|nr:tetratricopeptide repeat protein [Brevinema andersonii]SFB70285.1 hypothetical protein SAMN02745150_00343 [Brevinema andersonii]
MRKVSFVIGLLLSVWVLLSVKAQGQQGIGSFKNVVTGLAVRTVNNNSIELEWKSDIPQGIFNIYKNPTNTINTRFILRESDYVGSFNLQGQQFGKYYLYRYSVPMNKSGKFYFSVMASQGAAFDDAIHSGLPDVSGRDYSALPALNFTLQPVYFNLKKQITEPPPVPYLPYRGYFITSLDLFAEEDIFRLTWTVYPKDLDQYVFKIYRSRYPLGQFSSPQGLPEYARVTNRFYYEDKNINFEVPYYYAVVAENTMQWDIGINLFSRPAVVVRDAPPYQMPTQVEFTKNKRPLPVLSAELLSEDAIQKAVEQTLSNLQIAPIRRSSPAPTLPQKTIEQPFNITPLTPEDITNSTDGNYFLQQGQIFRAGRIRNESNFESKIRKAFEQNISLQEEIERKFLQDARADYKNFLKDIAVIENRIVLHEKMRDRLLRLDNIDRKTFKRELDSFFKDRDQIRLLEFDTKAFVRSISNKRILREKELFIDLQKIQDDWHEIQANLKQEIKAFQLARGVSDKFNNLNPKKINIQPVLGTVNFDSSQKIQTPFTDRTPKQCEFVDPYVYEFPQQIPPKERIEKIRQYYDDIIIEKVPTLDQNPPETWLKSFEFWLRDNADLWQEKITQWRSSVPDVLGQQYDSVQSKWLYPEQNLALREGIKAVQEERYAEAVYLLVLSPRDPRGLMLLGQSYYHLGAYREAFSVFLTATSMHIPEAKLWMELSAEKILQRHLREAS